ncbi:hypothetical protein ACX1IQ_16700 [Yersinia enterocolitica]
MKDENKSRMVGVRISDRQNEYLEKLISEGKAKNKSAAIQFIINERIIFGK